MTENLILTIAIGEPKYGQFALNLALSIKAQNPNQKIALIHTLTAVAGIEPLCEQFFDYHYIVYNNEYALPHEFAFALKTQIYDIATTIAPDATAYLYIDADCIMMPKDKNDGKSYIDEIFEKHKDRNFTAYCNDVYDYKTKTRKRKDYTFWCEPEVLFQQSCTDENQLLNELKVKWQKMPQINSSFIYFKKSVECQVLFLIIQTVWGLAKEGKIPHQKYKGAVPDELCFNIACAATNILPHHNPYRPIWFQFASENHSIPYIMQFFKAFGFAGNGVPAHYVIDFYNQLSNWYRQFHGVSVIFHITNEVQQFKDPNPIHLKATRKKTIYRCDEVSDSGGGIFNPDQIELADGSIMTIMRKEKNLHAYKMQYGSTGIAHVHILSANEEKDYDLIPVGYDPKHRLEDFRLIKNYFTQTPLLCNHKLILNPNPSEREMKTCLAQIRGNELVKIGTPELPIELRKTDINWVFWKEDDRIYCVYQLSPYMLFRLTMTHRDSKWEKVDIKPVELDFIHKSYICNSTNPILIGVYYLMFFHSKESGIYFHGACLINRYTKEIEYYTKNSINIKDLNLVHGLHHRLLYVSGAIYFPKIDTVRVLFNEGDYHSCYHEYNATELINAIKKNTSI